MTHTQGVYQHNIVAPAAPMLSNQKRVRIIGKYVLLQAKTFFLQDHLELRIAAMTVSISIMPLDDPTEAGAVLHLSSSQKHM